MSVRRIHWPPCVSVSLPGEFSHGLSQRKELLEPSFSFLSNEEINSEDARMTFYVSPECCSFMQLFWILFGVLSFSVKPWKRCESHWSFRQGAWPFAPKLRGWQWCGLWLAAAESCRGRFPPVFSRFPRCLEHGTGVLCTLLCWEWAGLCEERQRGDPPAPASFTEPRVSFRGLPYLLIPFL